MDGVAGLRIWKVCFGRQPELGALPVHNLEAAAGKQIGHNLAHVAIGPVGDRSFYFLLAHWVPAHNAQEGVINGLALADEEAIGSRAK